MDIHKQQFDAITKKYQLDKKAGEVADYVVGKTVSVKEFATLFAMSEDDAEIYLSFIHKGISFKEKHMD